LLEAQRHEALLNLAFGDTSNFDLYCPYDVETLDASVVDAAERTHPHVRHTDLPEPSRHYRSEVLPGAFPALLPAVDSPSWQMELDHQPVGEVHRFVASHAERLRSNGTHPAHRDDLALAAAAVSAGIGGERIRIWSEERKVLVEVEGRVPIADPLAGREWPAPKGEPAHGLWLANQLCDLVQWRSDGRGSVVRLRHG